MLNPWLAFESTSKRLCEYDLDIEVLQDEFRQKMKDLHPDRRSLSQLDIANQHSSMIKAAYDVLSNPIKRAEFICRLVYNLECFEENTNIDDDDFMLELLSANEYILEGLEHPTHRNYSKISSDIANFKAIWSKQRDDRFNELKTYFSQVKDLIGPAQRELLARIRVTVHACVAIEKLLNQLDQRLLELGYDISE